MQFAGFLQAIAGEVPSCRCCVINMRLIMEKQKRGDDGVGHITRGLPWRIRTASYADEAYCKVVVSFEGLPYLACLCVLV